MDYDKTVLEDFIFHTDYGKEEILREEFDKALLSFKSEIKFLIYLYNRELRKEDFNSEDIGIKYSSFNVFRQRLKDKNLIKVSKVEDKKEFLVLTKIGEEELAKYIIQEFVNVNSYILENIRESRRNRESNDMSNEENVKDLIMSVFSMIDNKPDVHRAIQRGYFSFNLDEIGELNPFVLENLLENFAETNEIYKSAIYEYLPISDREKFHKMRDNIRYNKLENYKSQIYDIHEIPTQTTEFIAVKGLLTKKNSKLKDEVYEIEYLCTNPTCEYSHEKIKSPGMEIKACPKCKSPFEEVSKSMKSCLNLELSDIDSESSISMKAYDNLKNDMYRVKVGEEITVYGYIQYLKDKSYSKDIDDKTAYDRVFVINNFYQNNNIFSLNDEEIKEIENKFTEINKKGQTVEDFLMEPFYEQFPYPNQLHRMMLIPQFQKHSESEGIIHSILVGSSGTGKTTYIRNLSRIFPKSHVIELKQMSEAKFYGGVKNDKITDLGICMKQRDGTLVLDEAEKDEDSFYKGSHMLNEVLGSQTATKEKVGVSIKLTNVNLRVITIMNPDPDKQLDTMQWINKNFHTSTINRFFVINFDYFINSDMENKIDRNYYEGNLQKIHNYDFEIRKKMILYLRNLKVDCNNIIDEIIKFQKEFKKIPLYYGESTTRNIRHLKDIIIGICKLKHKHFAEHEDLREAIELLVWTLKTKGEDLSPLIEPSAETVEMQTQV